MNNKAVEVASPAGAPSRDDVLREIARCFEAAYIEGLSDALAETSDARLKDLIERRILFANEAAIRALKSSAGAGEQPVAFLVNVRYPGKGKSSVYATLPGYSLEMGEELISETPLYAAPASNPDEQPEELAIGWQLYRDALTGASDTSHIGEAGKTDKGRKLLGYGDCKCILSQYCDGTCNPIFEDAAPASKIKEPADTEKLREYFDREPVKPSPLEALAADRAPAQELPPLPNFAFRVFSDAEPIGYFSADQMREVQREALELGKRAALSTAPQNPKDVVGGAAQGEQDSNAFEPQNLAPAGFFDAPVLQGEREALQYVKGCFDAAEVEGLSDLLQPSDDMHNYDRLRDIVQRRLMFAIERVEDTLARASSAAQIQEQQPQDHLAEPSTKATDTSLVVCQHDFQPWPIARIEGTEWCHKCGARREKP